MKYYITCLAIILNSFLAFSAGIPYTALIRDNNGIVIPTVPATIEASIITDITDYDSKCYQETFYCNSNENGRINLFIGEGEATFGSWDNIDWSRKLYLKIEATVNNNNSIVSVSSFNNVPKSLYALKTGNLISESQDGNKWNLKIRTTGDLYWEKLKTDDNTDDGDSSIYDKSKWPASLYLVGLFNNWDPTTAIKFFKLSEGRYSLKYKLRHGDIFKFISEQSWNGAMDWSGTSGKTNDKSPLRERNDTPAFEGDDGTYTIIVDFSTFTLLIYLSE